jgi:hypothetical protein
MWTLSVDMVSSTSKHRGAMLVHRLRSQRDLQVDINLVTSEFPIALADALDRTLQPALQVIPHPERDEHGLMAAQAG